MERDWTLVVLMALIVLLIVGLAFVLVTMWWGTVPPLMEPLH